MRFERSKPKEYKENIDLLRGEQEHKQIRNPYEPHRSNETNEEAETNVDDRFRAERNHLKNKDNETQMQNLPAGEEV